MFAGLTTPAEIRAFAGRFIARKRNRIGPARTPDYVQIPMPRYSPVAVQGQAPLRPGRLPFILPHVGPSFLVGGPRSVWRLAGGLILQLDISLPFSLTYVKVAVEFV
jgi:hypothetical protein